MTITHPIYDIKDELASDEQFIKEAISMYGILRSDVVDVLDNCADYIAKKDNGKPVHAMKKWLLNTFHYHFRQGHGNTIVKVSMPRLLFDRLEAFCEKDNMRIETKIMDMVREWVNGKMTNSGE